MNTMRRTVLRKLATRYPSGRNCRPRQAQIIAAACVDGSGRVWIWPGAESNRARKRVNSPGDPDHRQSSDSQLFSTLIGPWFAAEIMVFERRGTGPQLYDSRADNRGESLATDIPERGFLAVDEVDALHAHFASLTPR